MLSTTLNAVVLGGSGQVGATLVSLLSNDKDFSKITLISRRPLPEFDQSAQNRVTVRVVTDLDKIGEEDFSGHDIAFNLMGIGQARLAEKDELLRVDATIPTKFAQACKNSGINHFSNMSALGADIKAEYSWLTKSAAGGGWYNHVKGALEDNLKQIGFKSLLIVQPAGIYPGNANTPNYFGWLNELLNPVLPGAYNCVGSSVISGAMIGFSKKQFAGKVEGVTVISGGAAIRESFQNQL